MSSGSGTSNESPISRLGLYKNMDAKREEFFNLSRKRQIRQGCACAAIATAITVAVVVVVILIYEYAVSVERSLVQRKRGNNQSSLTYDQPFADRLDRSYFGLDQDYYERMPLLINALQESSYIDPTLETAATPIKRNLYNLSIFRTTTPKPKYVYKPSNVRRTSPRPFFFEYRSPTPLPFSKTYGSKRWLEKLRNDERLKNIRQIIKYLENTINAKIGDMHTKPTDTHIAFTGVYIEPMLENKSLNSDLQAQGSNTVSKFQSNHLEDPLFNFKPENPGDVNLLADDLLRFSPTPSLINTFNKNPMFRQNQFHNRNCLGNSCEDNDRMRNKIVPSSTEAKQTESPIFSTTKSFSVMLNLYPIKHNTEDKKKATNISSTQSLDTIYLTTSRPLVQFKRKSNALVTRRIYPPYKRPRYLSDLINKKSKPDKRTEIKPEANLETETGTQMIVHVKVYSSNQDHINKTENITHTFSTLTNPYTTKSPIELSTSQIEDYHAGSSGYIPVASQPSEPLSLPKVTTLLPFFETTTEYLWNGPTEVLKFNPEDAKIPNQYLGLERDTHEGEIQISRRNSGEKQNTLVVKLKNDYIDKNESNISKQNEETTTVWSYVPQINGHYRSVNQNSENVNRWLNGETKEVDRKKRLELSVSGLHTYVPMYKEIHRNHSVHEKGDDDKIDENYNDDE